jgi:hypothetical protein
MYKDERYIGGGERGTQSNGPRHNVGSKGIHVGTVANRDTPSPESEVITNTTKSGASEGGLAVEHEVITGFPNGPKDSRNPHMPNLWGEACRGLDSPNREMSGWDWDIQPGPHLNSHGVLEEKMSSRLNSRACSTDIGGGATLVVEVSPSTQMVDVGQVHEDLQLRRKPK